MLDVDQLDQSTRETLEANGFDTIPFAKLLDRVKREGVDTRRNAIEGELELLPSNLMTRLPEDEASRSKLIAQGESAIQAGQVGVVVLNGGMATRFGGRAKGVAEAVDGRSFLDLKLSQIESKGRGMVPVMLMNSFATEAATRRHLAELELGVEIRHFNQMVSLRLTPKGEIFIGEDARPSLHAPGHGDLPYALRRSGILSRFMAEGGRYLFVSNVDNLGASLDPLILGIHIAMARPVSVELVATRPGDVGGFPALVNGRPVLVEAFRAPESFDFNSLPRFNTNSFVFDAEALDRDFDLDWFVVKKRVGGKEAIQFERLVGQVTEVLDATWLEVPRDGPSSRFIPIKEPGDLEREASHLMEVLAAQGLR